MLPELMELGILGVFAFSLLATLRQADVATCKACSRRLAESDAPKMTRAYIPVNVDEEWTTNLKAGMGRCQESRRDVVAYPPRISGQTVARQRQ